MKYTGQFKNINNKLYQVDIITNNDSTQSTQLTFSGEPFKVDLNGDKLIYEPLKLSNATAGLIVDDYYFDIYSSTAQGTKLTLTNLENNTVEWVGYVTPNIYTQGFEQELEDLQIEAIDGLSTLDNFQYQQIDPENKRVKSFEDIIINCIQKCNCYNNIYVNKNSYLSNKTTNPITYNKLTFVSEFSRLGSGYDYYNYYITSQYPVSSDLLITLDCKYRHGDLSGTTFTTTTFTILKGETKSNIDEKGLIYYYDIGVEQVIPHTDVNPPTYYYDINVDATHIIPNSDENYYYVQQPEEVPDSTIDQSRIINKLFVSEQIFFNNDATVATDTTPATTETSLTYKEVLTEIMQYLGCTAVAFGDSVYIVDYDYSKKYIGRRNYNAYGLDLSNYNVYSTTNNWLTYSTNTTRLYDYNDITGASFKNNGATIELDSTYNQISIKTSENKIDTLLPEFFNDDNLTNVTVANAAWNHQYTMVDGDYTHIFKYYKNNLYRNIYYTDESWALTHYDVIDYSVTSNKIGSSFVRYAKYKTGDGVPATISFNDYICLHRHMQSHPSAAQNVAQPVLRLDVAIPESGFIYDDYYMLISGSGLWDDRQNTAYPNDWQSNATSFDLNNLKLTAKLNIGNKYWNGTAWTTTDSTFNIYFSGDTGQLQFKFFDVKNTVNYSDYIGSSGQKIPIKATDKLVGEPNFILYTPQNVKDDRRLDCVWLKDFKVDLIKPNRSKSTDTDTEYLNVIDNNYVNKFSEIDSKICSDTNKGLNYSVVLDYKNDTQGFENNTKLCTKTLGINQKPEYNYIQKVVNQYSQPRIKLNMTLENKYKPYSVLTCSLFQNKYFVVDKMSIDYYNDNNLLTIIEKV